MKKIFNSSKLKRFLKRTLCIILTILLIESDIPLIGNIDALEKVGSLRKVKAATYVKYDVQNYTKKDPGTSIIRIESWDDLAWYSKAYYEASQGTYDTGDTTVRHGNDTIHL